MHLRCIGMVGMCIVGMSAQMPTMHVSVNICMHMSIYFILMPRVRLVTSLRAWDVSSSTIFSQMTWPMRPF